MLFQIISVLPEAFDYFKESIIGRGQKQGHFSIKVHDLRDWSLNKQRRVDDTPYGGGPGMVMQVEPIAKALAAIKTKNQKRKVILMSAKGKTWTQAKARQYSRLDEVIIICGRYEGVDERIKELIDEEVSIGNYVLTGGELGAMTIVDSVARLLPGVLGNADSLLQESHSRVGQLEYPQYTKPEVVEINGRKQAVPEVLLSGNHREIAKWREQQMKKKKGNR
ncbi:MAG TPA: tRNA (guanosine(37)-N1)-methyltransferase TrmD [bacterium]|nr:tRNA (guanosine(37)-N1)-methyltransferase TrmD [bacterium]